MAEREEEADADGSLAVLHQLARGIVDGRDMVGIDGVTQAKAVRQWGRRQQNRILHCGEQQKRPGSDVEADEEGIDGDEAAAQAGIGGAPEQRKTAEHTGVLRLGRGGHMAVAPLAELRRWDARALWPGPAPVA